MKGPGKGQLSKTGNVKKIMVLLQAKTTGKPPAPPVVMPAEAEGGGQAAILEGLQQSQQPPQSGVRQRAEVAISISP